MDIQKFVESTIWSKKVAKFEWFTNKSIIYSDLAHILLMFLVKDKLFWNGLAMNYENCMV